MDFKLIYGVRDWERVWKWFSTSNAFFNSKTCTYLQFYLWAQQCQSWGILIDHELVGVAMFEPVIWPGSPSATDGYISFALARKVWGSNILKDIRDVVLDEIFKQGIHRVTGYTSVRNRAAQRAARYLGCKEEGRLRSVFGEGEDVIIYGLTKEDFYGRRT